MVVEDGEVEGEQLQRHHVDDALQAVHCGGHLDSAVREPVRLLVAGAAHDDRAPAAREHLVHRVHRLLRATVRGEQQYMHIDRLPCARHAHSHKRTCHNYSNNTHDSH